MVEGSLLKSGRKSLISFISLISLKSVHFVHLSLNGRRLSFENCLEALNSVISLKSGDFVKIDNFL